VYRKEEKRLIKTEFWIAFGVYMKKHNKEFGRVKWVNYKSHVKDIYFRLDFTEKKASFSIELQHRDDEIRELFYDQFKELKTMLTSSVEDDLVWEPLVFNKFDNPISRISCELPKVRLYNKDNWSEVFQFFESNMVGLHRFWTNFGLIFKQLED